jgi:hypothetical protein
MNLFIFKGINIMDIKTIVFVPMLALTYDTPFI